MNKSDSKKINQTFQVLTQAISSVRDAALSGLSENGVYLLTNMQQITIDAGNLLEEKEADCQFAVKKLEELCELYYECSILFPDLNNANALEQINALCGEIQKLIVDLKKDIRKFPVKTEILFLSYQVSMWDSLESVWKAASQDTQTDCYVMPLPVYDVLADNSLGELRYEGGLYPQDVPITSYQDYDIEKRHPDIIFFHNPYDDMNTVTRVPERYYSRNLKKYTELLVYVPYYMTQEYGPDYFQCYTPGILFADKAIVQPGAIYQRFCGIYTNFIKEHGFEPILVSAKDKFLPLGSPKTDKLANTNCEMERLPEQWQNAIRKPDGGRKKIVLYNLSISSLLANNEKSLKKIESVLNLFRKLKDDIILLWRPHPLLEKTLKTMRPQLRDAYEALIRQYRKEGWGIFDQTPDPNLAMAVSDAYYGDYSSLLISYQILNKPMLLQNVDSEFFHPDAPDMQLWFRFQPALVENDLWFTLPEMNGLYRFPLLTADAVQKNPPEAKLEASFDQEPFLQEDLYGDIVQAGELLIFPPLRAKAIVTFDTKTKTMRSYPLPEDIAAIAKPKFQTGFVFGREIYFIGSFSDIEMIRFHLDTGSINRCGCIPDRVAGLNSAEKIGYCTCIQQKIYIPFTASRVIVEYDIHTGQAVLKKLPQKYTENLKGVFPYTDSECLVVSGKKAALWNPKDEICTLILESKDTELDQALANGRQVFVFAFLSQEIFVIDMETDNIEARNPKTISCMHGQENRGISGRRKMIPIFCDKERLILFSMFYNRFLFLNHGSLEKEAELFTTDIPDIDFHELFCQHMKTEARFYQCSLENYLDHILHFENKNERKPYQNVGTQIYREIISL